MESKTCNCCSKTKSVLEFHIDRGNLKGECKECVNSKKKKRYLQDKNSHLKRMRKYDQSERGKQKRKERHSNKMKSDPIYKMERVFRSRILKALSGWCRSKKTEDILGCSWENLKNHLESLFTEGMTWENHGYDGWHVDHIIPVSSAKTLEELESLFNYKNLQPLWAKDNFIKGDKLLNINDLRQNDPEGVASM